MFEHSVDLITSKLSAWQEGLASNLPNAAVALLVIVIFIALGRLAGATVYRAVGRIAPSAALDRLAATMARYAVIAVGIFVALEILGLEKAVTSLLAGAGIAGLAIGIAFQDLAANFIAGVIMSIRRPFEEGDLVQTSEYLGFVRKMNMRNVFVETFEGQMVLVPNRVVFENALVNYSYTGIRRVDFRVPVGFDTDPDRARRVAERAVGELPFLAEDRPVEAFALDFGPRGLELQVRYWLKYPGGHDYFDATHRGVSAVRQALLEDGIRIAYPVRSLDFAAAESQTLNVRVRSNGERHTKT
jgi:small conductance mechanosensitive channel